MAIYFFITLYGIWSFFPRLAEFYIGPIPASTFLIVFLAATAMLNFRNIFTIPGWRLYLIFAVAIVISQINALIPEVTMLKALSFGIGWALIPFTAIWLREERYRIYLIRLISVSTFITCIYTLYYQDQFAYISRVGTLNFTLNGTAINLVLSSGVLWPVVGSRQKGWFERFFAGVVIALSLYVNTFILGSRTGFITQIAIMLIYIFTLVFFLSARKQKSNLSGTRGRVSSMSVLMILVTIVGILYVAYVNFNEDALPEAVQERFELALTPEINPSVAIRNALAQKSLQMFSDFWLFGGGWDNFSYHDYQLGVSVQRPTQVRYLEADGRPPHSCSARYHLACFCCGQPLGLSPCYGSKTAL
jgi:hypothetical protein